MRDAIWPLLIGLIIGNFFVWLFISMVDMKIDEALKECKEYKELKEPIDGNI